jgi:hypothetical protein
MKTRLAIIAVLAATAGVSTANAGIPAPYAPAPGDGYAPVLFPSEQGAFKGLEVAKQLVESYILQNGCDEYDFDLKVKTNAAGVGHVYVDGVDLSITTDGGSYEGRKYFITGHGDLGDLYVSDVDGYGSYNIGSEMQELTTTWYMDSPYSDEPDDFRGTIIKDYWRLHEKQPIPGICQTPAVAADENGYDYGFSNACTRVSTVIDYGYQQVQKHGYIAAKWWQQSQAWRQNGVRSGTLWKVNRVAPYGDQCEITVVLQGTPGQANTANKQGFNQTGSIYVGTGNSDGTGTWFKK